jgi:molybdopterin synthase catalytic subunit
VSAPVVFAAITDEPLDASVLADRVRRPDCGAVVTFEGVTRSPNAGRDVLRLEYEAFESRAVAQLEAIGTEVAAAHGAAAAAIVHRTGSVAPGEPSVVVVVAAGHRGPAFTAAAEILDRLKTEAAIWKREVFTEDDAHWVGM